MANREVFPKTLSAGDVNDRLSIPARWRDQLLPQVSDDGTASVRVVDEKGNRYDFVMKVRKNKTKPEFKAKGWKRFTRKRKPFPGDIIIFSRNHESPEIFNLRLIEVGPTLQLGLVSQEKPVLATARWTSDHLFDPPAGSDLNRLISSSSMPEDPSTVLDL